jgi:hypothetical protein
MTLKKIFAAVALSFVAVGLSGGLAHADADRHPHLPGVGPTVDSKKPPGNFWELIMPHLIKPPGNYWELICHNKGKQWPC